jgi:hypothetical protein
MRRSALAMLVTTAIIIACTSWQAVKTPPTQFLSQFNLFSSGDMAKIFGVTGAVGGALIGALIGSSKTDDWADVPLDRVRISIRPGPSRGVRFSVVLTL